MKHSIKITGVLLVMFFITQLIGLVVINQYAPKQIEVIDEQGNVTNMTTYNLPYGTEPPAEIQPTSIWEILISFIIFFAIAVVLMLMLMKFKAEILLRIWFFAVVALAIGITINSFVYQFIPFSQLLALLVAVPLAYIKVYKRNIILHNLTELMIYPGIAAIFVALLLSWTAIPIIVVSVILVLISIYDIYAVWHAGFMQKMAKYQINTLRFFTGFFVPYLGEKEKKTLAKAKASKSKKEKSVKVSVAILGGGDIVFPILLAGVVFIKLGLIQALIISLGATLALGALFYASEKGKFYPAMPFITAGCFIALIIAYML
jgi:presenilin-like A22 family membrane protease